MADRRRRRSSARRSTTAGPTLGFRITEGDTTLCYIPDHEPALGTRRSPSVEPEWISGFDLARDADLLIHDCQYTDEEYPEHVGWGHSAMGDSLTFASRVGARRVLLFHHDPLHTDDFLDRLHASARRALGGSRRRPALVEMAMEGGELQVSPAPTGAGIPA